MDERPEALWCQPEFWMHRNLRHNGVSEGWKKSPLMRNCFPLVLNAEGCLTEDAMVRLDDDLGLAYASKEIK
jgi:CRISPR-associated endonuclease/helicase Cas3